MTANLTIRAFEARPDAPPNEALTAFLAEHGGVRFARAPSWETICERREEIVADFLAGPDTALLMLDDDVHPTGQGWACLDPLLATDADVASARVLLPDGEVQHGGQFGGFACPAVRLSRRAIVELRRRRGRVFLHTSLLCECRRLHRMASLAAAELPWLDPRVLGCVYNGIPLEPPAAMVAARQQMHGGAT
jgi:hypothetical protein